MSSMFDTLATLPLFRGVTRDRVASMVGSCRFHFLKYDSGAKIVDSGEGFTHLIFVLSGSVDVVIGNKDGRFRVRQALAAPDVVSPDFLFGLSTVYPGDVIAREDCGILKVSKGDYVKILCSDEVFMFNLLNYLSMNAQKCVEGVLALTSGSIEERLAMWILSLTQPTAREIVVECRQRDLYAMLGVPRSSYMAAVERLVEMGVISYSPGTIRIADRKAVAAVLHNALT